MLIIITLPQARKIKSSTTSLQKFSTTDPKMPILHYRILRLRLPLPHSVISTYRFYHSWASDSERKMTRCCEVVKTPLLHDRRKRGSLKREWTLRKDLPTKKENGCQMVYPNGAWRGAVSNYEIYWQRTEFWCLDCYVRDVYEQGKRMSVKGI